MLKQEKQVLSFILTAFLFFASAVPVMAHDADVSGGEDSVSDTELPFAEQVDDEAKAPETEDAAEEPAEEQDEDIEDTEDVEGSSEDDGGPINFPAIAIVAGDLYLPADETGHYEYYPGLFLEDVRAYDEDGQDVTAALTVSGYGELKDILAEESKIPPGLYEIELAVVQDDILLAQAARTVIVFSATEDADDIPEVSSDAVAYTVIYWVEKSDDTETPYGEQTGKRNYDYLGFQTAEGILGELAEVPADSDFCVASLAPELEEYIAMNREKTETANAGKAVCEDGSTVVHVYYDRNVYSVRFSISAGVGEIWSWICESVAYDDEVNPYIITAKYGDYIEAEWPAGNPVSETGDYFNGWYNPFGTMKINTKRLLMDNEIAHGTPADPLVLEMLASDSGITKNVQYCLQGIDTFAYFEEGRLTQDASLPSDKSKMTAKALEGFTHLPEQEEHGEAEIRFYYTRNNYTLELNDGTGVVQSYEVPYQKALTEYNIVPEAPEQYAGCEFAGWYTSPGCYANTRVDFETDVMETGNLTLYAKWEK